MATLIIHAPKTMAEQQSKRSFQATRESGIGDGYAISRYVHDELAFASDAVVLLDKVDKRRAEGTLEKLVENGKTETGMKRYDVHIKGLKEVKYKPERLGRTGVAVIW